MVIASWSSPHISRLANSRKGQIVAVKKRRWVEGQKGKERNRSAQREREREREIERERERERQIWYLVHRAQMIPTALPDEITF